MISWKNWFYPSKRKSDWKFDDESDCAVQDRINIAKIVERRRYLQQNILHDIRQASLPCILGERDIVQTKDLNKIFASVWISSTQVIFSTKCKNIVVYDTVTGRKTYIPVISKPFDTDAESQSGGIHTIQINPSKTLLATGSMNSHDIVIYSLPHLEPLHYIDAHKDWLFSLQWISDSTLSSCSRDKTIALWSISRWSFQQLALTETHSKKVRSIAYNRRHKILSSISADGTFKLWDVNTLCNCGSVDLKYPEDAVCLETIQGGNIFAVGSQSHVMILDVRMKDMVHFFPSEDAPFGVRSLAFFKSNIFVGGGLGRLGCYDLRAQSYLESSPKLASDGFISFSREFANYMSPFTDKPFKPALFTISHNEDYSKMFIGGGPLHVGLEGSYAAIWE